MDENSFNLFDEPSDYYQPEKQPSYEKYTLTSGETLNLRLVGHNPLWGHLLWNAAKTVSRYIESEKIIVKDKYVLEFGAGAGLPSLVSVLKGAAKVVVTDYPDEELISNLQYNVLHAGLSPEHNDKIYAEGYLWGNAPEKLLSHLPEHDQTSGFHILILADILFNHSEHEKLVEAMRKTMRRCKESRALVFFTPYRPWLLSKDMDFFRVAHERGFAVRKVLEDVLEKVMFRDDPGDERLRRTVYGYELSWVDCSSNVCLPSEILS